MKTVKSKLTLLAALVLVGGIVFFLVTRNDSGSPGSGNVLRIEAQGICWTAVVPTVDISGSPEQAGCGDGSISLGELSGEVSVSKQGEDGPLTAIALVDDLEVARQSTTEPFGTVLVSF